LAVAPITVQSQTADSAPGVATCRVTLSARHFRVAMIRIFARSGPYGGMSIDPVSASDVTKSSCAGQCCCCFVSVVSVGATTMWYPRDASPTTCETMGAKRIPSILSNFCNWLSFFSLGNVGCRPDALAKLKGEMERSRAYSKGFFGVHNFKSSCMM